MEYLIRGKYSAFVPQQRELQISTVTDACEPHAVGQTKY